MAATLNQVTSMATSTERYMTRVKSGTMSITQVPGKFLNRQWMFRISISYVRPPTEPIVSFSVKGAVVDCRGEFTTAISS